MKKAWMEVFWFGLGLLFIVSIFDGSGQIYYLLNWSSPGAAGSALGELFLFAGFIMAIRVIVISIKTRKKGNHG
jgi:hypothetical protein